MKKLFALLVILSFCIAATQSQTCRLMRDSIIVGQRVSTYGDYIYGTTNGLLGEYLIKDSGSVNVTRAYSQTFNSGANHVEQINEIDVANGSTLQSVIRYSFSSGKVSHIRASGGTDTTAWVLSHHVNYDGSGNLESLIVDSVVNQNYVNGIPANFININWTNGNISGFTIELGSDHVDIVASYDTKNNVNPNLVNTEGAFFLLFEANANNVLQFTLAHDDTIPGQGSFPAGHVLLSNTYTYTSNNDVETLAEAQSLFTDRPKTTQYIYDCSSGILSPNAATAINIYPNPASEVIRLDNGNFKGDVRMFDVTGKTVFNQNISSEVSSLDIRSLQSGVYYVEMTNNNQVFKGKFLKN